MRKLASIQKIDSIRAIEGADRIVCAHVGEEFEVTIKLDGASNYDKQAITA